MDRKQMRGMINSQFHFTPKKTYRKRDYVPLEQRGDWDGKVEVLRPVGNVPRPAYKS